MTSLRLYQTSPESILVLTFQWALLRLGKNGDYRISDNPVFGWFSIDRIGKNVHRPRVCFPKWLTRRLLYIVLLLSIPGKMLLFMFFVFVFTSISALI